MAFPHRLIGPRSGQYEMSLAAIHSKRKEAHLMQESQARLPRGQVTRVPMVGKRNLQGSHKHARRAHERTFNAQTKMQIGKVASSSVRKERVPKETATLREKNFRSGHAAGRNTPNQSNALSLPMTWPRSKHWHLFSS